VASIAKKCGHSLSSVLLAGKRLMKLVYQDEGGTAAHERYLVVSGVVVDGDRQLVAIENHLDILVQKHIPEPDRPGFIFHATDIWSGKKYFADRDKWSMERRLDILRDLARIPSHFDVPVAWGFVDKNEFPDPKFAIAFKSEEVDVAQHIMAFTDCSLVVEDFMRTCTDEIALIIAEDRDIVRLAIKEAIALYRDPAKLKAWGLDKKQLLPFRRIRDTVHFAKKPESRHLQLADACTFFIRGHLNQQVNGDFLYSELKKMLLVFPAQDSSQAKAS
jgi:hypothetical protein